MQKYEIILIKFRKIFGNGRKFWEKFEEILWKILKLLIF